MAASGGLEKGKSSLNAYEVVVLAAGAMFCVIRQEALSRPNFFLFNSFGFRLGGAAVGS